MKKKLLNVALILASTISVATCQEITQQIKSINEKVLAIEASLTTQPLFYVDSSTKRSEPFKELYYKNTLLAELGKVDKVFMSQDVKISYYFYDRVLIKAIVADKSTNYDFIFEAYFHAMELIYMTHRSIDGDNSAKRLIESSQKYLNRYDFTTKHN